MLNEDNEQRTGPMKGRETASSQSGKVQPFRLRGSSVVYGRGLSGGGGKAAWPVGSIEIHPEYISLRLAFRKVVIERAQLRRIHWFRLPRPHIRLFHNDPKLPLHVYFGTMRERKLRSALKHCGY